MKFTAALAAELAALTDALDDPDRDIEQTLRRLMIDAAAATTAFAGITVTINIAGRTRSISALIDSVSAADVVSSLRIPLSAPDLTSDIAHSDIAHSDIAHIVLYARRAGSLVDLAADLSWLSGQPLAALILDEDVANLPSRLELDGIGAERVIDQAAGVLIAGGMTIEQAYGEIERRAGLDGGDPVAVAHRILDELTVAPSDPGPLDG